MAHSAGLVHRDIKLDNLFLCEEGAERHVLKSTLGIAELLPSARRGHAPLPGLATSEGDVLGTPRYIPPEQALGRSVGPQADLYAAGVVLYQLVTGRDPFHDISGFVALLQAHVLLEPPPPSQVAPQPIAHALDEVVMRALAKRPEDRYASATELSNALARAQAASLDMRAASFDAHAARRGPTPLVACVIVLASAVLSALAAVAIIKGQQAYEPRVGAVT